MEFNLDAISVSPLIKNDPQDQALRARKLLIDQTPGFSGIITGLVGETMIVDRLRELGFVPGHQLTLKGRSPFGDPLIVDVNGTSVALRREEAVCIQL